MIGGLISSTALTLVLVPVLYRLVEGRLEKQALLRSMKQGPGFAVAAEVEDELARNISLP